MPAIKGAPTKAAKKLAGQKLDKNKQAQGKDLKSQPPVRKKSAIERQLERVAQDRANAAKPNVKADKREIPLRHSGSNVAGKSKFQSGKLWVTNPRKNAERGMSDKPVKTTKGKASGLSAGDRTSSETFVNDLTEQLREDWTGKQGGYRAELDDFDDFLETIENAEAEPVEADSDADAVAESPSPLLEVEEREVSDLSVDEILAIEATPGVDNEEAATVEPAVTLGHDEPTSAQSLQTTAQETFSTENAGVQESLDLTALAAEAEAAAAASAAPTISEKDVSKAEADNLDELVAEFSDSNKAAQLDTGLTEVHSVAADESPFAEATAAEATSASSAIPAPAAEKAPIPVLKSVHEPAAEEAAVATERLSAREDSSDDADVIADLARVAQEPSSAVTSDFMRNARFAAMFLAFCGSTFWLGLQYGESRDGKESQDVVYADKGELEQVKETTDDALAASTDATMDGAEYTEEFVEGYAEENYADEKYADEEGMADLGDAVDESNTLDEGSALEDSNSTDSSLAAGAVASETTDDLAYTASAESDALNDAAEEQNSTLTAEDDAPLDGDALLVTTDDSLTDSPLAENTSADDELTPEEAELAYADLASDLNEIAAETEAVDQTANDTVADSSLDGTAAETLAAVESAVANGEEINVPTPEQETELAQEDDFTTITSMQPAAGGSGDSVSGSQAPEQTGREILGSTKAPATIAALDERLTPKATEPKAEDVIDVNISELLADYQKQVTSLILANVSYPSRAVARSQQGRVKVSLVIDRNGKVLDMNVVDDPGYKLLVRASEKAVRKTRRLPPLPAGYPDDSVRVTIPIAFKLP